LGGIVGLTAIGARRKYPAIFPLVCFVRARNAATSTNLHCFAKRYYSVRKVLYSFAKKGWYSFA
jgi:hypothetical protein